MEVCEEDVEMTKLPPQSFRDWSFHSKKADQMWKRQEKIFNPSFPRKEEVRTS